MGDKSKSKPTTTKTGTTITRKTKKTETNIGLNPKHPSMKAIIDRNKAIDDVMKGM